MIQRVITGVILSAVAILVIVVQGWAFYAVMGLLMLFSFHEVYSAFRARGEKPVCWPGYLFCALAALASAFHGRLQIFTAAGVSPEMVAFLTTAMLAIVAVVLRGRVDFGAMSASVFPFVYPGVFFLAMLGIPALGGRMISTLALFMTVFVASMNDCFALFVGLKFGKHKLSPEISPKKSVEGSVGGLAAAVVFSVALPLVAQAVWSGTEWYVPLPPIWAFAVFGLVAGALSQAGDLAASLIKRHCGVKDFGRIFPGHGGILDRLDGILFCAVACYVFFAVCA